MNMNLANLTDNWPQEYFIVKNEENGLQIEATKSKQILWDEINE